jgi:hypothetical protein
MLTRQLAPLLLLHGYAATPLRLAAGLPAVPTSPVTLNNLAIQNKKRPQPLQRQHFMGNFTRYNSPGGA